MPNYLSKHGGAIYKSVNNLSTWAKLLIVTILVLALCIHLNNRAQNTRDSVTRRVEVARG